jgi:hypothetical protein
MYVSLDVSMFKTMSASIVLCRELRHANVTTLNGVEFHFNSACIEVVVLHKYLAERAPSIQELEADMGCLGGTIGGILKIVQMSWNIY